MHTFQTIAFYNVENLFDTVNDPDTYDDDFTPQGKKAWTINRYKNKLGKIAKAISEIGKEETGLPPSIVGLAEVENKQVLQDLIQVSHLQKEPYKFVHFDSKDERGIDVALLYNSKFFTVEHAESISPPEFIEADNSIDYTRDILYVNGKMKKQLLHFFVVHLPSQRHANINKEKREAIAALVKKRIDLILCSEKNPFIVVLGDFNANPQSDTLKKYFKTTDSPDQQGKCQFFNPMELLIAEGKFTNKHKSQKILYDQMLFSKAFLSQYPTPNLALCEIFNPYFLQEWKRQYKGLPFRTYVGRKYVGGYSDHFPVYSVLKF